MGNIQPITENVSSSEFAFTFVTIIISVFVRGHPRAVQIYYFSFCTARSRPGTKTEIIIVANGNVNSEDDTFSSMKVVHYESR